SPLLGLRPIGQLPRTGPHPRGADAAGDLPARAAAARRATGAARGAGAAYDRKAHEGAGAARPGDRRAHEDPSGAHADGSRADVPPADRADRALPAGATIVLGRSRPGGAEAVVERVEADLRRARDSVQLQALRAATSTALLSRAGGTRSRSVP